MYGAECVKWITVKYSHIVPFMRQYTASTNVQAAVCMYNILRVECRKEKEGALAAWVFSKCIWTWTILAFSLCFRTEPYPHAKL